MTPRPSPTHIIIYTPASLQREAWRALLAEQPFIEALVTACEVSVVAPLVEPGQPTTVLVDLPGLRVDLAQQLHAAAPEAGLLFLVDDYDLDTVLPLAEQSDIVVVPVGADGPDEPTAPGWRGQLIGWLRDRLAKLQQSSPGLDAINRGWWHDLGNFIIQYCHLLRPQLNQHPDIKIVGYQEL